MKEDNIDYIIYLLKRYSKEESKSVKNEMGEQ